jgi:gingipain R
MKKITLFFLALVFISLNTFAQKGYQAQFSQPNSNEYQISFSITEWNLEYVVFDGVNYQQINFSSSAITKDKGWAELHFVNSSIQLPAQKNVDLSITYTEFTDYQLDFPLVPSKGTISRSQDPNSIPYQIDIASMVDKFYPGELATAEEPYIIRDVRGTTVSVFPFQYNAVTNTLRVYTKMDVLLTENNEPATNPLLKENPNPIREVRGMYKSIFMNHQESRIPLTMAEYGDILVVTTARDEEAIQPYIDWKKEKGYNVTKEVVATGTNVKSLIKSKYDDNINLMYVLLVGGWNEIKSDLYTSVPPLNLGTGPTDPMLGDVAGNIGDCRPDVSIGRMSASNAAEVTVQVNKTIQYEKNPNMDAGWYSSFIGIGSNDNLANPDDGEKDWLHIQRIYSQRLEPKYNYNQHYRLYENESGCTSSNLFNYINTGASTIAYCGHGATTYWVTTGFSNTNINQLTNGTKLPFIVSVACVNGSFHNQGGSCFAERWLKKENGGAGVTWMSTINQPIGEPMRGQDYFYDILIGGFDYSYGQYGIPTNELRTHWGALVVNSANLMLSEVNLTADKETVRTWCTFGDPNLQLRTKLPTEIVSTNNDIVPSMEYVTTITVPDGGPVADALVCLSQDDVYVKGFTDEFGNISLEHPFTEGNIRLVVTAFNTTTIYETITVGEIGELFPPLNLTYTVEKANHVILNWDEPEGKGLTVTGYNVYRDGELINAEPVRDEVTFTDVVPANGEYKYEVTALYGTTMESDPSEPVTVSINGMCIPIGKPITVEQTEGANILISWEAPEYEGLELAGYNVYRDEEQLNEEIIPADELSYLDENVETDIELCYRVEVVYNDCEEPLITEKECLTLVSVKEVPEQTFNIYPNPVNSELRVTSYELRIEKIEIYDVYGRKVGGKIPLQIFEGVDAAGGRGSLTAADGVVINVAHLHSGIYFVKVYSGDYTIGIKKLIINH